jgi:mono/diheme cytochrome c family protein
VIKIILAVGMLLFLPSVTLAQPVAGPAQDPLAGSRVFGAKGCSKCHAVNGVGGKVGPDLGKVRGPRSFYDLATAMWNHIPEMAAEMRKRRVSPPQLSPREAGDLIAFLATLNYFDPSGNAKIGRKHFNQKHCVACHQVEGVGGVIAPSLDSIVQFGPIFFATAMWNHGPAMTEAMEGKGIKRPVFKGAELRDLIAYLESVSLARGVHPLHVLPGRAREGERLFASNGCVDCHGIKGLGGPVGPALAGQGRFQTLIEFAAAMWNKAPAMAREMKRRFVPVPQLQASEMADIIAYLYSVQYFAGPGEPRRGEEIVAAKGCLGCHSVRGKGGTLGPSLEKIRGLDQPVTAISAMWNHAAAMERKMREQAVAWPVFKGDEMAHVMAFLQSLGKGRE